MDSNPSLVIDSVRLCSSSILPGRHAGGLHAMDLPVEALIILQAPVIAVRAGGLIQPLPARGHWVPATT
ncbi:hypothetical protein [Accumulibacter sp.]|uniref:hypothetical protein n=1 Tax=Accumulibacter sp. TaxID=2053492 RepID=UPI0028C48204|nr:hypothetical protein [Accumulibacter sp.]